MKVNDDVVWTREFVLGLEYGFSAADILFTAGRLSVEQMSTSTKLTNPPYYQHFDRLLGPRAGSDQSLAKFGHQRHCAITTLRVG